MVTLALRLQLCAAASRRYTDVGPSCSLQIYRKAFGVIETFSTLWKLLRSWFLREVLFQGGADWRSGGAVLASSIVALAHRECTAPQTLMLSRECRQPVLFKIQYLLQQSSAHVLFISVLRRPEHLAAHAEFMPEFIAHAFLTPLREPSPQLLPVPTAFTRFQVAQ